MNACFVRKVAALLCVISLLGLLTSTTSSFTSNDAGSPNHSCRFILSLRSARPSSWRLRLIQQLVSNYTGEHNLQHRLNVSYRVAPLRSNVIFLRIPDLDSEAFLFLAWLKSTRQELFSTITNDRVIRYERSGIHHGSIADGKDFQALVSGFRKLRQAGYSGAGVKVAVFDTGLSRRKWSCKNLREVTVWTSDDAESEDRNGHGTAVAGLLCSANEHCPGLAPDVELFVFKLYSETSEAMTSWFLGALDYAIHQGIDLINLSIGGPDFLDEVFMAKLRDVAARGITVISAVGNDGPLFGTAHNPADMPQVIAVGGLNSRGGVAAYSSRGMTAWELSNGK